MAPLIDRPPTGWLARLLRAPAVLFRWRLGWLFRGRLLRLSHLGRRSGRPRETVLEVVAHQEDRPVWYVAPAWGDKSDWYRNLEHDPVAEITVGRTRHRVVASVVSKDRATQIHDDYVGSHPWRARIIGRLMGIDLVGSDPHALADRIPVVALSADDQCVARIHPVARATPTRAETRAMYDRIAPFYEPIEGLWERKARAVGLEALAPEAGESIIDIGCGPGHLLTDLAGTVGPTGQPVGVDLAGAMCTRARRRLRRRTLMDNGAVVQADAVGLPFAAGTFDAGVMSFTLELFDTPEIPAVLDECRRVLRPGGRLAIVALSKEEPAPLMQRAYERGHRRFPRLLDCRPIRVEAALADAGFRVTTMRKLSVWGIPVVVAVGEC